MKIISSIILLFLTTSLYAQSPRVKSTNLEASRSYIIPASSAQEASESSADVIRYAIPVDGWKHKKGDQTMVYSSWFDSPFSWISRQSILRVESASAPYTLRVGDNVVGSCYNPSMVAEFNVTEFLVPQAKTPITITLHHDAATAQLESWRVDQPFELGNVVMLSQPTQRVRDVELRTTLVDGALNASGSIVVQTHALNPRTSRILYELYTPQGTLLLRAHNDIEQSMREQDTIYFSTIIPDSLAWSAENPQLFRLDVATQYRGRYAEYQSFKIGMRSLALNPQGELEVNGKAQSLRAKTLAYDATAQTLTELKQSGFNAVKLPAGAHNRAIYSAADSLGIYVIATAPINTSKSGTTILRGGNPTNDPKRVGEYQQRVEALYHTAKLHPSVVALSLGENSLNGINLYESYLYLKQLERERPVIYEQSAGQWNSDGLKVTYDN